MSRHICYNPGKIIGLRGGQYFYVVIRILVADIATAEETHNEESAKIIDQFIRKRETTNTVKITTIVGQASFRSIPPSGTLKYSQVTTRHGWTGEII